MPRKFASVPFHRFIFVGVDDDSKAREASRLDMLLNYSLA